MEKKLILVTSPPASGKTFVSKCLAQALSHVVYLDKDTLITLSRHIFEVANEPFNRSSDFFQKNIRDAEYDCVLDLAMEALDYDDLVLINAPFTQEIRDMDFITSLRNRLAEKNARLVVIWVVTSPEVIHQRMIDRDSDRDTWKLEHWDEYIAGCNFTVPWNLHTPGSEDDLIIFHNNSLDEFRESMQKLIGLIEEQKIN